MPDLTTIYRDKSPSLASKLTLASIHLLVVVIVVWLLFGSGITLISHLLGASPRFAPTVRRWVLVITAGLYFVRTLVTMFIFMKRRMPWSEVGTIALWICMLDILFAWFGGRNDAPFAVMDVAGIVLVLVGSVINTGSELQRHLWKRRSENTGHIYTGGLFRFARHINYFGDEVLFTGWAVMTGQLWVLAIPAIMVFGFLLVNIPSQDRYLEDRYGDEYRCYAKRVKRFIPYVY